MVNFPGGFPGRPPTNPPMFPPGFPGGGPNSPGGPGGRPNPPGGPGFPGGGPNFPGGPGGRPNPPGGPGFPGGGPNFPGGPDGRPNPPGGPGGGSARPPSPPPQLINQFNYLQQNPTEASRMLQQQNNVQTFAAGCNGRWTIIRLWNGQLFLMYVLSTNVFGNTTGIIWPFFTFGSFPSSQIAFYQCF